MPEELFLDLGGGLPVFSIYRAIVLCMFLSWLMKDKLSFKTSELPFIYFLLIMVITESITLLLSVDYRESFKPYLSFITESVLFYIILASRLKYEDIYRMSLYLVIAVIVIAYIGIVERYTDFNPVDYIPISGRFMSHRHDPLYSHVIYSTLSHPIMLGATLAMGWPLCLLHIDKHRNPNIQLILRVSVPIIFACVYFTFSRGPWIALVFASGVLVLFRYPFIKKRLFLISLLIFLVFLIKPGTYETIFDLTNQTVDPTTIEGSSFYYRFELLKVAYEEVNKDTGRFFWGYGQDARRFLHIEKALSYDDHRIHKFYSWDNQLAATLLEKGFVGLLMTLILYLLIIKFFIGLYKNVGKEDKSLVASLLTSVSVFMFMTTNVLMFSHQLYFLFWVNMSLGVTLYGKYRNSKNLVALKS